MTSEDFIIEDYKLALDYLKSHFDRLWTRFNFFLTIEVGLFGFLGWLVFEKNNPDASRVPAILGMAVSALWYVFAAEDRALVDSYRERVERAAKRIAAAWPSEFGSYATDYIAAAQGDRGSIRKSPTSWYRRGSSITQLPVLASILLLILWLALFFVGPAIFGTLIPTANQ